MVAPGRSKASATGGQQPSIDVSSATTSSWARSIPDASAFVSLSDITNRQAIAAPKIQHAITGNENCPDVYYVIENSTPAKENHCYSSISASSSSSAAANNVAKIGKKGLRKQRLDPHEKLNPETKIWNLKNQGKIKGYLTVIRKSKEDDLDDDDYKCPGCESVFRDNRVWAKHRRVCV